jgi:hypothetical protein
VGAVVAGGEAGEPSWAWGSAGGRFPLLRFAGSRFLRRSRL